jgi:hypothetical protein
LRRDKAKSEKDALDHDKRIMNAIGEDLKLNRGSVAANLLSVEHELSNLSKDRVIVQPLFILKDDFWDLAINHMPKELNSDKLAKLREISFLTMHINEAIRSRNEYRLNGQMASNYHNYLRDLDQYLLGLLKRWSEEVLAYDGQKRSNNPEILQATENLRPDAQQPSNA